MPDYSECSEYYDNDFEAEEPTLVLHGLNTIRILKESEESIEDDPDFGKVHYNLFLTVQDIIEERNLPFLNERDYLDFGKFLTKHTSFQKL